MCHRAIRLATVGALAFLSFLLSGCATLEKVGLLTNVDQPEPPFGPPDSTGLVIVECQVFYDTPDNLLQPGKLVMSELKESIFGEKEALSICGGSLRDSHGNRILGAAYGVDWSETEMLILFCDLPPGLYRLAQVEARYSDYNDEAEEYEYTRSKINIPPGALGELTVTVQPGDPVFIGRLIIFDDRDSEEDDRFHIDADPKYEVRAYKKLLKKYKRSPWVPHWRRRLDALVTLESGGHEIEEPPDSL
ncbi:MAG: hypothetical protein JSV44_12875 [Candidatus Zixiibacteriota bacterium]|nr:MAG: hypothetical protein JSV44_12875 [candidate division Zixibacteria bacterium]